MGAFKDEVLPLMIYMKGVALKLTKNAADAEDLLQDTFLSAYASRDSYTPGTHARRWLLRIMKNAFTNAYKMRIRRRDKLEENRLPSHFPYKTEYVPDDTAIAAYSDEVQAALESLPTDYQELLELYWVFDYEPSELTEVFGIKAGTVMSRCHRSKVKLQTQLREYALELGITKGD